MSSNDKIIQRSTSVQLQLKITTLRIKFLY